MWINDCRVLQLAHLARVERLSLKSFNDSQFNNLYLSPYIRALSIRDSTASPAIITALLQHMLQLESLSISRVGAEQTEIKVNDMTPMTKPVYIIQNLPNLKRLSLYHIEVELNLASNLLELVVENCSIVQYMVILGYQIFTEIS
jgi:hypothetical protein